MSKNLTQQTYALGFIVIICTFLSSCGFAPLYGTNNSNLQQSFDNIYIENIPNNDGQHLRNLLLDKLYKNGRPQNAAYILTLSPIKEKRINLDITKNADATRGQLLLNTKMLLTNKKTKEIMLQKKLRVVTSYNVLNSQFTTHVSENNAKLNALEELALQIETQLALYFSREQ